MSDSAAPTAGWGPATAVFVGSLIGTGLRVGVSAAAGGGAGAWPWGTLTANLTGAVLLGFIVTRFRAADRMTLAAPLLTTGLLGSYTTFSAFAVETRSLVVDDPLMALAYVIVSLLGGLLAAGTGVRLASSRG